MMISKQNEKVCQVHLDELRSVVDIVDVLGNGDVIVSIEHDQDQTTMTIYDIVEDGSSCSYDHDVTSMTMIEL